MKELEVTAGQWHVRIVQRKAMEMVEELSPEKHLQSCVGLSVDPLLQVYKGRLPGWSRKGRHSITSLCTQGPPQTSFVPSPPLRGLSQRCPAWKPLEDQLVGGRDTPRGPCEWSKQAFSCHQKWIGLVSKSSTCWIQTMVLIKMRRKGQRRKDKLGFGVWRLWFCFVYKFISISWMKRSGTAWQKPGLENVGP